MEEARVREYSGLRGDQINSKLIERKRWRSWW